MSVGPDDADRAEAARWVDKALEDRAALSLLLRQDALLAGPAAFHAQQAAEKLIKALLVLSGTSFPKTHDIDQLMGLLVPMEGLDGSLRQRLLKLTPWAVRTRCPSLDDDQPSAVEIEDALDAVNRLLLIVQAAIDAP